MVISSEKMNGNYTRSLVVNEIDGRIIEYARSTFAEYKAKGIMLNDSFDDETWRISNEMRTATLMIFDEIRCAEWIGCELTEYQIYVKVYISLNLGELSVYSLQELARILLQLSIKSAERHTFLAFIRDYPIKALISQ